MFFIFYFTEEKRQKRKEQQQQQLQLQQQQQQQPQQQPGAMGQNLKPCAPPVGAGANAMSVAIRPLGVVNANLRSHSPNIGQLGNLTAMGMQQHPRMPFSQQQQQQQQQGMLVGPSGPSPNGQNTSNANMVPNPGLSPFGQPQMSQTSLTSTTTSVTTSQFPTSNGTAGLPNSSPVQNQHQFQVSFCFFFCVLNKYQSPVFPVGVISLAFGCQARLKLLY